MVYIQRYLSFIILLSCLSILFSCGDAPPDLVFDNPLDGKQAGTQSNNNQSGDLPKVITAKDVADMVLIPAGEFQMGSNDSFDQERPVHTVYLDAFYIDKYPVTNAQYKKFTQETGRSAPIGLRYNGQPDNPNDRNDSWGGNFEPWNDPHFNGDNQPVVCVSWEDINAYAQWAGKRLPTEAEYEKAARGGLAGKRFPWGDTLTHDNANYWGTGGKDKWGYTSPVGSFAPNSYGLYDMTGNVRAWCADWLSNYEASPVSNPTGPSFGPGRVLRGGSWIDEEPSHISVSVRYYTWTRALGDWGFRCAMDVPK